MCLMINVLIKQYPELRYYFYETSEEKYSLSIHWYLILKYGHISNQLNNESTYLMIW